jgi:hypothetical protein
MFSGTLHKIKESSYLQLAPCVEGTKKGSFLCRIEFWLSGHFTASWLGSQTAILFDSDVGVLYGKSQIYSRYTFAFDKQW